MTNQEQWSAIDEYVAEVMIAADAALDHALQTSAAAKLPEINVSRAQGKFLHLLARIRGAKKILEIGTLGGYSAIWLARALPAGGKLITLEFEPKHADVARANIANAGLSDRVELIVGKAIDSLPKLAERGLQFDFTFIDADKPSTADYFAYAVDLATPGAVIIVDNVIRKGAVIDGSSTDANVQGIRRFNDRLKAETRVDATAIQTVGAKGYDGFTLAIRK